MPGKKIEFQGHDGLMLAGMLELPQDAAKAYALFAHCFTCSKDIFAASRISTALTDLGIAVLRFDFTGLGNSQGDFANTNFSSNVEDLVSAYEFMTEHLRAPSILIGHSLGGAAVLMATPRLRDVKAVVTIGAPASAKHVEHLFAAQREEILTSEQAVVSLGGRNFTIKRQFIEDLDQYSSTDHIANLRAALLIFHAPLDATVPISEASRIYTAAKHPKSFVSLDGADHLLTRKEDSVYTAQVLSSWARRYVEVTPESPMAASTSSLASASASASASAPAPAPGEVRITEANHKFGRIIRTDTHQFSADEPTRVGGSDAGPDPYELLLSSLGACTSMTIRMYANRKKISLTGVDIVLRHTREHAADCEGCEDKPRSVDVIERDIILQGNFDESVRQRLLEIADRCPVHQTLKNDLQIRTRDISNLQTE